VIYNCRILRGTGYLWIPGSDVSERGDPQGRSSRESNHGRGSWWMGPLTMLELVDGKTEAEPDVVENNLDQDDQMTKVELGA